MKTKIEIDASLEGDTLIVALQMSSEDCSVEDTLKVLASAVARHCWSSARNCKKLDPSGIEVPVEAQELLAFAVGIQAFRRHLERAAMAMVEGGVTDLQEPQADVKPN